MSDPIRFDVPERFRGGVDANAGDVADACPGAILGGERVTCNGTVLAVRRGNMVYRYALCAACTARENEERRQARELSARAPEKTGSRLAKVRK